MYCDSSRLRGRKFNHGTLLVESLLQISASFISSESLTLFGTQDIVQMILKNRDSDDEREKERSAISVEDSDEDRKEETCNFHKLQATDRQGVSALHNIRTLCTHYSVSRPESISNAHGLSEDGVSIIPRVAGLFF